MQSFLHSRFSFVFLKMVFVFELICWVRHMSLITIYKTSRGALSDSHGNDLQIALGALEGY